MIYRVVLLDDWSSYVIFKPRYFEQMCCRCILICHPSLAYSVILPDGPAYSNNFAVVMIVRLFLGQ